MSMLGKYKILYADPPWAYNDRRAVRKDGKTAKRGYGSANLYDVMDYKEIAQLQVNGRPVQEIAAPNSAIFLWTTWPHIEDALLVMCAWGFEYKTCAFDWMKSNGNGKPWFGVGYYAKSNTEPCLLGIRGKMKPVDNSVSMAVYEPHPRGADGKIIHSRKPATVRDRIVQLFGDVPRIELFARERTSGWDAWGNELERENNGKEVMDIGLRDNRGCDSLLRRGSVERMAVSEDAEDGAGDQLPVSVARG